MSTFDRRRHRALFNGDVNFLFHADVYNPDGGKYTPKVLHDYIELIADSGVDTYLANANAQVPWYPSKVVPHVLTGYKRGDRDFVRGQFPPTNDTDFTPADLDQRCRQTTRMLDRYLDLVEAGVDWIAEIVKACRRRGVSPWVSVRMNDMHGSNSWEKSFMNCPPQRDPRLRLSGAPINPKDPIRPNEQAVSYDHRETREFMFAMIRELVADYDVDGIELDWLRCPFCCEPPATQATIDTMTEWLAEIRALTQAKASTTGRPCSLGLRTPVRLGLLRTIGLDVREYARRGLIDFLGVSNFFQTTWDVPYDRLRGELGESVALYGLIEAVPNWLDVLDPRSKKRTYRLLPASPEFLRGNAAGKLALGADGVELYNYFCADEPRRHPFADKTRRGPNYSALRGAQDLDFLRGKPKQYVLSSMDGLYMFPLWEYAEQVPVRISPGERRAFRLPMCAEPADAKLELIVQIVLDRSPTNHESRITNHDLGVSFNGSRPNFDAQPTNHLLFAVGDLTHHIPEHTAFNYRFPVPLIQEGWNEVLVFYGSRQPAGPAEQPVAPVTIASVEFAVQAERSSPKCSAS